MKRVMPLVLMLSLTILATLGWSDVWVLWSGRPWGDSASNAVETLERSGSQASLVENNLPPPTLEIAPPPAPPADGSTPSVSPAAQAVQDYDQALGEMTKLAAFLTVPYANAPPDFDSNASENQPLIDIIANRKEASKVEEKLRKWESNPEFEAAKKKAVQTDLDNYQKLQGRDNALVARITSALEGKVETHLHVNRGAAVLAIDTTAIEDARTEQLGKRLRDLKIKIQTSLIDNDFLLVTDSGLMRFDAKNNGPFANQKLQDSFDKAFEAAYEIKRQHESEGDGRPLRIAILWVSPVGLDDEVNQNLELPSDLKDIVTLFWVKTNARDTPMDRRFTSAFPDHFQAFANTFEDGEAFGAALSGFVNSGSETP